MPSSLCPTYCHVTVFELNREPCVCAFVNAIPIILPCMIFLKDSKVNHGGNFPTVYLSVCKNADWMKWNLFVENTCSCKKASQIQK